MDATETFPAAALRAGRARGKRRLGPSGGARFAALHGLADQRQPVIAEIHVGLVEEDRRRAEAAARHDLLGVGLELVLDRLLGNSGEESLLVDSDLAAD